jgi:HTH-type transcriptional regulator, cell division transcriptional repressor
MRHDDANAVGRRIAKARKEAGLTQEELASRLGVTPRSVQGYEAGRVAPYRHLPRLAELTRREIGWFLEGDEPGARALAEVAERLVALTEQVAEEATRLRAAAERLEALLASSVADR